MNRFSCWKSFVCFNYPKNSLFDGKKTPIIYCITHLLLMTLHSERLPIAVSDVILFDLSVYEYLQQIFSSTICGSNFMCSKKITNFSKFDWDRQSGMCDYHVWHRMLQSNRPRASQIRIGVIIVMSIKTQSLCDILIGRKLNEITPTAQTTGHFMINPGASD